MRIHFKFERSDLRRLHEAHERAADKLSHNGTRIIRREIKRRRLVNTGRLLDSVGAVKTKSSVIFDIDAEYAGILNKGVRRHKMRYLVNAGPLPIVKRNRKMFRVATEKNIEKTGKWIHPGFKRGKGLIDSSCKQIHAEALNILAKEINLGI